MFLIKKIYNVSKWHKTNDRDPKLLNLSIRIIIRSYHAEKLERL